MSVNLGFGVLDVMEAGYAHDYIIFFPRQFDLVDIGADRDGVDLPDIAEFFRGNIEQVLVDIR